MELDLQMPPSKMYDTLLNTATKIGTTVASNPIGQLLLEYTERCLWTVEKSVQWCMLPQQKSECKDEDVSSNEVEESTAKSEDTVEPESEIERPLPWVLFLPLLVCLKAAKTSIDVCSYVLRRESLEPSSIVEFIQNRRNLLKEMKDQIKSNLEEENIRDEPSDPTTLAKSDEVPEIKVTHATPEKEIAMEAKAVTETAAPFPSETVASSETVTSETLASSETVTSETARPSETEIENVVVPSVTSSPEREDGNSSSSSSTLEPSLTEKEEDEDFHSVKSSSTYFSPDSSYSLQSVSEESRAGDNLATELENDTKDVPSIAAAIEDLRSLSVSNETPLPASTFTSSVKQTETIRKRTSLSSFFQVRRKAT